MRETQARIENLKKQLRLEKIDDETMATLEV
jgi:hypothetical protein